MEGRYRTGSGCKVQLAPGEKYMLTIKEATEYFNIGSKALRRLAESHTDEFAIVMGNTCLKVDEKRTLYIYVKREYIADEDKCQQWYIDNKRDIMPHIELDLILETKSGERYLERLKCGSSWDAGMQDVEQTVTRQIGIYKNSVEKYETDN